MDDLIDGLLDRKEFMISSEHRRHANLASALLRCLVQVRNLLVRVLHARINHNLRVLDKFVCIVAF